MRLAIALSLLLVPGAVEAGQRATYVDGANQKLIIEVADNGEARIGGEDPTQYGIFREGQFYLVARKNDQWSVARMEDVATAVGKAIPGGIRELFGAAGAAAPKAGKFRAEAAGRKSYLGRDAQLYRVYFAGSEKPDDPTDYLVSSDPALKPVGAALEQFSLAMSLMMGAFMGPGLKDDIAQTRAVFALGTPLEIEDGYKLVSLEKMDVPHERTELPAKPKTLEEVIAETEVRPLSEEEMKEPERDQ